MRLKLGAQVVAVAAVLGLLGLLIWKVATQQKAEAKVNEPAPHFTLPRLDKPGSLSLSSLRGKAVVLNFWASWCGPCRDEVPRLNAAWKRYRSQGLVVLGIDQQDLSSDARRFAEKYGVTYPLVRDGPGHVVAKYGLTGVPETFFVNRRGRLVGKHIEGAVSEEELAAGIKVAMRS